MIKIILRNTLVLSVGSAIGRLVPLGLLFLLVKTLDLLQYNTVSTTFLWVSVTSYVIAAGISVVMTQQIAQVSSDIDRASIFVSYYCLMFIFTTVLSLITFIFGDQIFNAIFGNTVVSGIYKPCSIAGWAWPQVVFFTAVLNGLRKIYAASLLVAIGGIFQGLGILLAFYIFDANAIAIAWGFSIGSIFAAILGLLIVRESLKTKNFLPKSLSLLNLNIVFVNRYKVLLNTISISAVMPIGFMAGLLIAKTNDGVNQLAQFYFLEQINQIIVYFPAILGQILMPFISNHIFERSLDERRQLIKSTVYKIFILILCVTCIAILVGFFIEPILKIININQLPIEAAWATRLMLYNAFLTLPLTVLGAIIIGSGKIYFGCFCNIAWGICVFLGSYLLLSMGNAGFQVSRICASLIVLFVGMAYLMYKKSEFTSNGELS